MPKLNDNLAYIIFNNNPIYIIIESNNKDIIKRKVKTINNFRHFWFMLKHEKTFRKWLWEIRERRAMERFHPDYLQNLSDDADLDLFIEHWTQDN